MGRQRRWRALAAFTPFRQIDDISSLGVRLIVGGQTSAAPPGAGGSAARIDEKGAAIDEPLDERARRCVHRADLGKLELQFNPLVLEGCSAGAFEPAQISCGQLTAYGHAGTAVDVLH